MVQITFSPLSFAVNITFLILVSGLVGAFLGYVSAHQDSQSSSEQDCPPPSSPCPGQEKELLCFNSTCQEVPLGSYCFDSDQCPAGDYCETSDDRVPYYCKKKENPCWVVTYFQGNDGEIKIVPMEAGPNHWCFFSSELRGSNVNGFFPKECLLKTENGFREAWFGECKNFWDYE